MEDFPGCETVAGWQQAMAACSWEVWLTLGHGTAKAKTISVNWSGVPFATPGPTPFDCQWTEAISFHQLPTRVPDAAAIFALCVLDRIEAPVRFLAHASRYLRPHGLLFLTVRFWNAEGDDHAAGHESRRRIYNADLWKKLVDEARPEFRPFGGMDWQYHGDKLGDHTLASLVLIKRGGRRS